MSGCSTTLADVIPAGSLSVESPVGQHDVDVASSVALLETLPVKGRAPKTGYSRDQFGQAWSDDVDVEFGHDGCDTRNNLLASRLTDVVFKEGKKQCVVLSGTLADPYTGKTINFVRGQDTSTAVQIDHVVALSDSWQKGAQQLGPQERTNLANDPRNLLPVDGPTNAKKSDSDAASWLPPNKAFRCTYVSMQISVKSIYKLWVTQAEKDAMAGILSEC
ncbi:HNH endonuclease [Rhodococcus sp. P-2]|nr:HNH endonuclease [Rhodococcus sp. P-2]